MSTGSTSTLDAAQQVRIDVAAACRLVEMSGWSDLLASHVSARVPGTDRFVVNPYGLLFDQVSASSLALATVAISSASATRAWVAMTSGASVSVSPSALRKAASSCRA